MEELVKEGCNKFEVIMCYILVCKLRDYNINLLNNNGFLYKMTQAINNQILLI